MRHGIFVHQPDGDMGFGYVVGAFQSVEAAAEKARAIERAAERHGTAEVECIVLPLLPGSTSAKKIATTC